MESIGSTIEKKGHPRFNYEELVAQILADPDVAAFIAKEAMSQQEIQRSISKFNQYITERNRYLLGDDSYIAKGYKPILIKNEGFADVSYEETPELIEAQRLEAIKDRISLVNMPSALKNVTFEDIDFDESSRREAYMALVDYVVDYPSNQKGLYLYGDFGVGKSFMVAALAYELSERKQAQTMLLHYPTFVQDAKDAIKESKVRDLVDEVKRAPLLILDDIGAESNSSWVRDEVLQVILQHRMHENLPTFFTSNFSFEDLERHLANGRGGDETWQAKRVMERIQFLAKEVRLGGYNRRNGQG